MTTGDPRTEPYLAEQFDDLEQQERADFMGMWVFLATELLLFGGVFMGFAIYRTLHADAFAEAARHLDLVLGSINTALLLTSGLTMALAERAVAARRKTRDRVDDDRHARARDRLSRDQGLRVLQEFDEQLVPLLGLAFVYDGTAPAQAQMFFNFYFVMTGLHAFHMAIGLVAIAILLKIGRGWAQPDRFERQCGSRVSTGRSSMWSGSSFSPRFICCGHELSQAKPVNAGRFRAAVRPAGNQYRRHISRFRHVPARIAPGHRRLPWLRPSSPYSWTYVTPAA